MAQRNDENTCDVMFVEVSTTQADPGEEERAIANNSMASPDTTGATAGKIVEVGFYIDNGANGETLDVEVGLYTDAGNDEPETLLYSATGTTGTAEDGWKTIAVDWDISPSTVYWLAVACETAIASPQIDYDRFNSPAGYAYKAGTGKSLLADWGTSDTKDLDGLTMIYAVTEAAPSTGGMGNDLYVY